LSQRPSEAGDLNFLPAALAAVKKIPKHVCASMLNLQQPVWAKIKIIINGYGSDFWFPGKSPANPVSGMRSI
jgi:hypothetical protein